MNGEFKQAIIKTLAYSDIFDFPLNQQELYWYLEAYELESLEMLSEELVQSVPEVGFFEGYFFLTGREKLVERRKQRQRWSQGKMTIARSVVKKLRFIPWVKMVAVTGAVAAENATEDHDIDLLIVTAPKRLWLARLAEKVLTELMRVRRQPSQYKPGEVRDKVCPNMYMDVRDLRLPHQDLFTAREIAQMKVVLNKDNAYERFLAANQWVKQWLPNWWKGVSLEFKLQTSAVKVNKGQRQFGKLRDAVMAPLEFLSKRIQFKYMEGKRTTETISNTLLMFHPQDQRVRTMERYHRLLRRL